MKIAIDLRWIRSENIDGTSRYAIELVSNLLRHESDLQYLLLGDGTLIQRFIPESEHAGQVEIGGLPERLLSMADFWRTPRSLQQLGIDVYHSPSYLASPFRGAYKKILTVFDLIPFLFPEALSKSRLFWKLFYATRYPAAAILRSADVVVTASEHTRRDLVRLLNIPAERIRVIWIGLDSRFHPGVAVTDDFVQRYHLPQKFLLYVGRQDPYKGIGYLVKALALLPQGVRDTYGLVIAGKTDPRYIGEVHAAVNQAGLEQRVHFIDYVPDADLPALYKAATLLVHPSLYEGFGLTPLEAMACGTPVVYADTSSLTELIGKAGYAVEPASAEALAAGMLEMLNKSAVREAFIQQGLQHVKQFSWESVIQKTVAMYTA
jgi:glycosyltransferase involved in cell wall biosynthesis